MSSNSSTAATAAADRSRRFLIAYQHSRKGLRGCGGRSSGSLCEHERPVPGLDTDSVAFVEVALQQSKCERVLDQALQRPLERARTVGRIPAGLGDELLRLLRQLEL